MRTRGSPPLASDVSTGGAPIQTIWMGIRGRKPGRSLSRSTFARPNVQRLRVDSFNSYARGAYADELLALQSALDSVFRDARQFRGLVIDVCRNSGGADPLRWRSLRG